MNELLTKYEFILNKSININNNQLSRNNQLITLENNIQQRSNHLFIIQQQKFINKINKYDNNEMEKELFQHLQNIATQNQMMP